MLRLYNTLTQKLEEFVPRTPGKVKAYVCGITTYDYAHAGHARTYTAFDVLTRHLRARGLEVTLVRNVTDVDDKIVKRANELGEAPLALSARMSKICDEDLEAIGVEKPTHEPRVSTHIPEIIALIERLIANGNAYPSKTAEGTDVYFAVRNFEPYGKLSRRKIDDLLAGARVEVGDDSVKKDPLDFALWKGCAEDAFGWASPWGQGRPGWHIECSAMAHAILGPELDIHAGGMDLIFPHHENEVAQSEAANGVQFSRFWLHSGFLNVDSEKMSKSLGNFVTIRDVLARNDAEGFRYFLLGTHYRGPIAFDLQKLEGGRIIFPTVDEAERRIEYLYTTFDACRAVAEGEFAGTQIDPPKPLLAQAKVVEGALEAVLEALDKDLNTPQALAAVGELAKAANEIATQTPKLKKNEEWGKAARVLAAKASKALIAACQPLGLMLAPSEVFFKRIKEQRLKIRGLEASTIEAKIKERIDARSAKDFARADELRKELTAMGVEVLDSPTGSTWKVLL